MSEKMSINVEILGVNAVHNFLVPDDMDVSRVTELIIKTLIEEYPNVKSRRETSPLLLQKSTGKALTTQGCGLKQLGIVNGEQLVLV